MSLPTALWLVEHEQFLGNHTLYTPATNPAQGVRDAHGQLKGCKALERHWPRA